MKQKRKNVVAVAPSPADVEKNRIRPLEAIGPRDLFDGPSEEGLAAFKSDARHRETRVGAQRVARQEMEGVPLASVLQAGDPDVSIEDAELVGDEAPGGDNPTPDQDVVEEIGRAYGLEYEDNEPLRPAGKIERRDEHRWELHPASSEDFAARSNELSNPRLTRRNAHKGSQR